MVITSNFMVQSLILVEKSLWFVNVVIIAFCLKYYSRGSVQ